MDKKAMENKYTLEDAKGIPKEISDLVTAYEKAAKGPAKLRVLSQQMPKYVKKIMESAARKNQAQIDKLESDHKLRVMELEEKVALNKQELERLQDIEKTVKSKLANMESLIKQVERNEQELAKKLEIVSNEKMDVERQVLELKDKVCDNRLTP